MAKTQFILFNHSSSLWCQAQDAPAPFIVWKKNGIVLQNSTSVTYQLTITDENNDKYSCEVNRQDGFDKKYINLVMERELFFYYTFLPEEHFNENIIHCVLVKKLLIKKNKFNWHERGSKKFDSPIRIAFSEIPIIGRMLYHRAVTENSWRDKGRTKALGEMENSQSARIVFMVKFPMQDFFSWPSLFHKTCH